MNNKIYDPVYRPIIKKLDNWITYMETAPKGIPYNENRELFDEHRKTHDLDCILTGGNLYADTIFSLWTPLKSVIYCLGKKSNDVYKALGLKSGDTIYKKIDMLKKIKENIETVLPKDEPETNLLSRLFDLGQERCNVMILPNRNMNSKRGERPYNDYMPYFLSECFEGGAFASYFENDEDFIKWIQREKLQRFFEDGDIKPEKIKDLNGSGDVKNPYTTDIMLYLDNYIKILVDRFDY